MINDILDGIDEDNFIQHVLDDLEDEDDKLPSNEYISINLEDYLDLKETDLDLGRKLMNGETNTLQYYVMFEHPKLDTLQKNK